MRSAVLGVVDGEKMRGGGRGGGIGGGELSTLRMWICVKQVGLDLAMLTAGNDLGVYENKNQRLRSWGEVAREAF